jgi:hypothetical protein
MQTFMSQPKGAHQPDMRAYAFANLEDAPPG